MRFPRLVFVCLALLAGQSEAHFKLNAPTSWWSQDLAGSPQKAPPCGADGTGSASGVVTTFHAGDMVTISVNEIIFHPGHYRVALGVGGPGDLPAEPPVTAGTTACGSTVIQSPAVYPVLADGQLLHTSAFSGTQTFQVKLPDTVTCTKCTLQVMEFMSNHGLNVPGGCFYHHCADIQILAKAGSDAGAGGGAANTGGGSAGGGSGGGATGGGDGGGAAQADAGTGGGGNMSGAGCSSFGTAEVAGLAPLALLAWLVLRRARSS